MRSADQPDGPCVQVRVPAKINLFLAVRGVRDDGYHELITVFQTVSVFDRLRVGVYGPPGRGHHPAARRRMRVQLLDGEAAGLPQAEHNLAMRAARVLADHAGIATAATDAPRAVGQSDPRTVLELTKGIPIAGGMAGGSADAAAALVALNELWGCALPREDLRELGADLGSDVPFCVVGGTALASGRGTAVAQVLCRGSFDWVVATSDQPLATADVYSRWDADCVPTEIEPDAVLAALRARDAEALGAALHNDLEPAAFALRPELAAAKAAMLEAGALGAVLSGSGPTMLALADSPVSAARIAAAVREGFDGVQVATSPAGGPDIRPC